MYSRKSFGHNRLDMFIQWSVLAPDNLYWGGGGQSKPKAGEINSWRGWGGGGGGGGRVSTIFQWVVEPNLQASNLQF